MAGLLASIFCDPWLACLMLWLAGGAGRDHHD
jgi:hypothetical protein